MNIENLLFTLENGKKYMIIETVQLDGKQYAYLVNRDNEIDSMFREVALTEEKGLKEIDKDLFKEKIYPMFIKKFESYKD